MFCRGSLTKELDKHNTLASPQNEQSHKLPTSLPLYRARAAASQLTPAAPSFSAVPAFPMKRSISLPVKDQPVSQHGPVSTIPPGKWRFLGILSTPGGGTIALNITLDDGKLRQQKGTRVPIIVTCYLPRS